jgi:hypothetical protein
MTHRRTAAAAATAWLVSIPLGAFVHHGIFGVVYAANAAAFRPDPEIIRRLPIGYAAQLIGFWIAAWMYGRLYTGRRGIIDGLRFGALIGLVLVSFGVVWNYVTQPISAVLGVAEVFECAVTGTIYGGIIGAVCRQRQPGSQEKRS